MDGGVCLKLATFVMTSFLNVPFVRFSIGAFKFISIKKTVFFHCQLVVCKMDSDAPECTQTCASGNARKRRGIDDEPLDRFVVDSGAVRYVKKDTCGDIKCAEHSTCYDLYPAQCRCDDGSYTHTLVL